MKVKSFTVIGLVQSFLVNQLACIKALLRGWKTYSEEVASKRNEMIKWYNMAIDCVQKYERGEEKDLFMVKTSLTAVKQIIDKDIEFDSYIVEYLNDLFRMTDQSRSKADNIIDTSKLTIADNIVPNTPNVTKVISESHDFNTKVVERHKKLIEALSHFDNTVILNPLEPGKQLVLKKKDDTTE